MGTHAPSAVAQPTAATAAVPTLGFMLRRPFLTSALFPIPSFFQFHSTGALLSPLPLLLVFPPSHGLPSFPSTLRSVPLSAASLAVLLVIVFVLTTIPLLPIPGASSTAPAPPAEYVMPPPATQRQAQVTTPCRRRQLQRRRHLKGSSSLPPFRRFRRHLQDTPSHHHHAVRPPPRFRPRFTATAALVYPRTYDTEGGFPSPQAQHLLVLTPVLPRERRSLRKWNFWRLARCRSCSI